MNFRLLFVEHIKSFKEYYVVIAITIATIVLARILEYIRKKAYLFAEKKTKWIFDDILFDTAKGVPTYLVYLLGIWSISRYLNISKSWQLYISNFLAILAIVVIVRYFYKLTSELARRTMQNIAGGLFNSSIFYNILRVSFILLAIVLILNVLHISIAPILTALGVGGLAVALALQPTLSNLFSGLQILASKQVQKGDFVKLSTGEEGIVSDINWRHTIIKSLGNNTYIIPNSKLLEDVIVNYEKPEQKMSVIIPLGVSYDSNLEEVEQLTLEVAKKVMQELDPEIKDKPLVRFKEFGNSSIKFIVILKASRFEQQFLLKHEFIKAIIKAYDKHGIKIPYPISTVILEGKNEKL